jgi:hypothetical protein
MLVRDYPVGIRPAYAALAAVALLLFWLPDPAQARHITAATRRVSGVTAHVVTINLRAPQVKVSLITAQRFPRGDEAFSRLARRSRAVAAINGTFCDHQTQIPLGDLVADGRLLHEGRMGTAMAITPENEVFFGRVAWGRTADWSGYETVLAAGPTLIKQGRVDLKPRAEGFADPRLLQPPPRSAVGLTARRRLLLVSVPQAVTLDRLAEVMKALGCVEAMNLDGGASRALYYRGEVIARPRQRLSHLLVAYEQANHVDLGPPLALPEGNGLQPLSARAPRPVHALAPSGGADEPPDWFPVYPGAEPEGEPNCQFAQYSTEDSIERVLSFYRRELAGQTRASLRNHSGPPAGVLTLLSGPGAQSQLHVTHEAGGRTVIRAFFARPGAPPPHTGEADPVTPPAGMPSAAVQRFYQEMAACVEDIQRPAAVPDYPGLKRQHSPREIDRPIYQAPAAIDRVVGFYRKELGSRARITIEPRRGQIAVIRILSGAGAGYLVQLIANGAGKTTVRFFRGEPRTPS